MNQTPMSGAAADADVQYNPPRKLNRNDAKTLSLSALGGALEFYDFIIFVFYANVISQLFFPATLDPFWASLNTYGAFAAGYFARPLGGVVMAHFGDLVGRKRMFTLSILLMAIPTLCIGFLPTFESIGYAAPILLLLMRVLQGIAIGGEIPAAWVFVAEHVPQKRIGLADGTLTMGLVSGILLGSLMALAMSLIFSEQTIQEWAWRLPFIVGGVLGFVAMYLRRWLEETPIFKEMKARKALHDGIPLKTIFAHYKGAMVLSGLLTWLLTGCVVVMLLMAPNLMSGTFNMPRTQIFTMQSFAILATCLGCVASGMMCDKIGAAKTFVSWCLALLVSSWVFYHSLGTASTLQIAALYAITGFFGGILGSIPYVMVHLYPANIRFSGISFSYNIAYAIFGGITPILIVWLNDKSPVGAAYYMAFLAIMGVCMGLYLFKRKI